MMQPVEHRNIYPHATNDAWTAGFEYGWERARSSSCKGVWNGQYRDACRAGDEDYADRLEKDPGSYFQPGQDTKVIDAHVSARMRANTQEHHSRSQRSRIPRPISRDSNDEHGTNLALIVPPSKIPRPVSSSRAFNQDSSASTSLPYYPPPSTEIPSNVTPSSTSSSYNDLKSPHLTTQKRHIPIPSPSFSPIFPNPLTININSNPTSPTTIDTLLDACIAKTHTLLAAARNALASTANLQDADPETDDDDYERKCRNALWRKNDVSAMMQVEEEEESGTERHDSSPHLRQATTNVRNTPTGAGEEEQSRSDLDSAPSTTTSRNKDIVRVGGWYKITTERPSHWRAIGRG